MMEDFVKANNLLLLTVNFGIDPKESVEWRGTSETLLLLTVN